MSLKDKELKKCNKCKIVKPISYFSPRKNRNNKPTSYCKECNTTRAKEYYYANTKRCKLKNKQFFLNNPFYNKQRYRENEEVRIKSAICAKQYRAKNLEKCKKMCREYYFENSENIIKKSIEKEFKKRQTIRGMLDHRMSVAIWASLSKEVKNGRTWKKFVNFTTKELKQHLESRFVRNMSWDEFLNGKIHIDHIIPKINFSYNSPDEEEFKKCWSLSNLQPLWATENLKKHDKII